MNDLVFVHDSFEKLRTDLLRSELETCAILLANIAPKSEGTRLLVKQVELPPEGAYAERTQYSAQLKPEFIAPLVKRAKVQRQALVFVHTHPGATSAPHFSPIDDRGEQVLDKFLKMREVAPPHAALVLGPDGCSARLLNSNMPVRVIQVGVNLDVIYDPIDSDADDPIFDRQVRAFGQQRQAILKKLTIGIVGLGGTGSVVAQQLAYLGVEKYLLVDPDTVEASNLNRLVGTTPADTGKSKVGIAERYIKSIRPDAKVIAVQGSVLDAKTARMLVDTDFFFCCTDSHGSRAVLNQLAAFWFTKTNALASRTGSPKAYWANTRKTTVSPMLKRFSVGKTSSSENGFCSTMSSNDLEPSIRMPVSRRARTEKDWGPVCSSNGTV